LVKFVYPFLFVLFQFFPALFFPFQPIFVIMRALFPFSFFQPPLIFLPLGYGPSITFPHLPAFVFHQQHASLHVFP
jgi:hypothetical protein